MSANAGNPDGLSGRDQLLIAAVSLVLLALIGMFAARVAVNVIVIAFFAPLTLAVVVHAGAEAMASRGERRSRVAEDPDRVATVGHASVAPAIPSSLEASAVATARDEGAPSRDAVSPEADLVAV
jgi:hypothetical protein